MVKKPHVRTAFLAVTLLVAASLFAADPKIRNLGATANGPTVAVHFTLVNGFADADIVKALQSGLPTSFEYVIEIYRSRPNWFDQGISRSRLQAIATFNSLTREYVLNYRRDRRLVRTETFSDLESLERRMSTVDEPALFDIGSRRPYKLHVRVRAEFGRTFLLYVIPATSSTSWADVRVATAEPKP